MRTLLPILLWLIWTAFGGYWYVCKVCNCCTETQQIAPPAPVLDEPLLFKWADSQPVTGSKFAQYKADILSNCSGLTDTLVITTFYDRKEPDGLALAKLRGEKTKALFAPPFSADRIKLLYKPVDGLPMDKMFAGASFDYIKGVIKKEETTIISEEKSATILFPFNSKIKDSDPKVDAFLKNLCAQHKADKITFTITGHTDNIGEDASNERLGLSRAQHVKALLVNCGLSAARIKTASQGEKQPVATNDNEDGRHQNRRVVIDFN